MKASNIQPGAQIVTPGGLPLIVDSVEREMVVAGDDPDELVEVLAVSGTHPEDGHSVTTYLPLDHEATVYKRKTSLSKT